MAPITGKAAIAYLPNKVVGISKLRVLHGYAERLQIQERLTASSMYLGNFEPQGVAVIGGG